MVIDFLISFLDFIYASCQNRLFTLLFGALSCLLFGGCLLLLLVLAVS